MQIFQGLECKYRRENKADGLLYYMEGRRGHRFQQLIFTMRVIYCMWAWLPRVGSLPFPFPLPLPQSRRADIVNGHQFHLSQCVKNAYEWLLIWARWWLSLIAVGMNREYTIHTTSNFLGAISIVGKCSLKSCSLKLLCGINIPIVELYMLVIDEEVFVGTETMCAGSFTAMQGPEGDKEHSLMLSQQWWRFDLAAIHTYMVNTM